MGALDVLVALVGVGLVVLALADLVNTLVTTATSYARFWPTRLVWVATYETVRAVASRLRDGSRLREGLLATYAPLLLVTLLAMWCSLQLVGFSLVWWAMHGLPAIGSIGDALYYSGVVFFTVGFGEIVPEAAVPRTGALVEAFFGVVTVALVIGYLPSLYAAYSERERALMLLDDGGTERITPTSLLKAWAPDADPKKLDARLQEWEKWTAHVLETHSTLPLLRLFRSHDARQHWVTALGLVTDAGLQAQLILGAYDGYGYWQVRRATALFDELTRFAPPEALDRYRDELASRRVETPGLLHDLYAELEDHGFDLLPYEIAEQHARKLRSQYGAQLEFLIDYLLAPRGFWPPHGVDVPLLSADHPEVLHLPPSSERTG